MYCDRMQALFDTWVAPSFDKQEHCRVGPDAWTCDLAAGRVRRSAGEPWLPAQFLGRESECGERWTWAWAFSEGSAPRQSLRAAEGLRSLGRQQELLALLVPSFDLNGRCGHQLAMIASGIASASYYVECEGLDGSYYFLVEGWQEVRIEQEALDRIFRIFPQVVNRPEIRISDQREAFRSYLRYYGFEVATHEQGEGSVITGRSPGSPRLILGGFDRRGRALGLAEAVEKKRRDRGGPRGQSTT